MESIATMIAAARKAQLLWSQADQFTVDSAVKAIARTVFDHAEELARRAVDEAGMGVYEHKVRKNRNKARLIWNSLKDKKSVGIIGRDPMTGIISIAKPMGVVGAVTPCTNPIVTPMCNGMFAVKGGNSVIFAPHPRAVRSLAAFIELVSGALKRANAPENLMQYISDPSIEKTLALMKQVDVVVATGGMGMVKSAYSSGKPAYGVGVGNVQCILDREIEIDKAVEKIIEGRCFDNGIICSCEQAVIAPRENQAAVVKAFIRKGAVYVNTPEDQRKLTETLFINGAANRDCVGVSAAAIAEKAGIPVPSETRLILVNAAGLDALHPLRREKMCPVLALFAYADFDEAIAIARTNLMLEGKGHSVAIHSQNAAHIENVGLSLPISRVVVNQPCATSAGGSFANGFAATTTLGCGTWGNNIISENLDYKHLINITRIGLPPERIKEPDDKELWG